MALRLKKRFFDQKVEKMKVVNIGRHPENDVVVNDPIVGRRNVELGKCKRIIQSAHVTQKDYEKAWFDMKDWRNYRDVIQMQLDSIKASNSSKH